MKKPRRVPGRIEIINWRCHGDEESYCWRGVYRKAAKRGLREEIEEYQNTGYRPVAQVYINDTINFWDGQVITHNGRKWLVRVEEVREGKE
jgi:hypothetical protein